MDKALVAFNHGSLEEVKDLEQRIVDFLPGAKDVPHDVRMAMAQIGIAHGLDPFLKEIWPIPVKNRDKQIVGWELMIGISGWRNAAHRSNEYWGRRFEKVTDEDRKAIGAGSNDLVARCIVMRRKTGQQPAEFDGYGLARSDEFSKMNKFQLARLRAERDAMKAAFPISAPIGVVINAVDDEGNTINGDHGPDLESLSGYDAGTATGEIVEGSATVIPASTDPVAATTTPGGQSTVSELDDHFGPRATAPQPAAPKPVQPTGPSGKVVRPISPVQLKEFIARRAEQYKDRTANPQQRGLAASQLEACFAGDMDSDLKRHSVQQYLFGVESVKDVSDAQIIALLDWLKPAKDSGGHYSPEAMSAREAQAVVTERIRELRQQTLPI